MMLKQRCIGIWICLIVVCLLTACSQNSIIKKEGSVVIKVKKSQEVMQPMYIPVESTNILIRLWNNDQNIVKTFLISETTTTIEIKVPAGVYSLDAIAYNNEDYNRESLTMGSVSNIIVKPSEFTDVNMVLERPTYNIEIYNYENGTKNVISTIEGGKEYYVDFSVDTKGIEFKGNIELSVLLNGKLSKGETFVTKPIKMTSPTVAEASILSIQLRIDTRYSTTYDHPYGFCFPSTRLGEPLVNITVTPPEGGVIIGIE